MTYDILTPASARLWKYEPNWSEPYRVTRAFKTDIITSRNNTEQRRALRDVARMSVGYSTFVRNEGLTSAEHNLRAAQNAPAVMPDFSRYVASTGASSGGSSTVTVASPPAWIAEGQIIVANDEAAVVAGVSGSTITLDAPLSNAWPSGSIIRPGLFGLLDGELRSSRIKPTAATLAMGLSVYPGAEPPEDEGTASDVFNGYEVFTAEPDWRGSPTLGFLWPVEQVDFGIGRTAQFRPVDRQQTIYEAEFNGLSISAAVAIEQVFLRAKGRRGAFYHSTCRPDMKLAANATGTSFTVQGSEIGTDFGTVDYSEVSQAIEIVQTNGTRVRRLITDISAGTGVSTITVNSAVSLTTATTARISWMPLVRFASDELTTEWASPRIARIRTSFQSVIA